MYVDSKNTEYKLMIGSEWWIFCVCCWKTNDRILVINKIFIWDK